MSTDEIRIAMAELEGWTPRKGCKGWLERNNGREVIFEPNHYDQDLNAVRRVVNGLNTSQRLNFLSALDKITVKHSTAWFPQRIVESTPLQWCEAFLRVTGKWKE